MTLHDGATTDDLDELLAMPAKRPAKARIFPVPSSIEDVTGRSAKAFSLSALLEEQQREQRAFNHLLEGGQGEEGKDAEEKSPAISKASLLLRTKGMLVSSSSEEEEEEEDDSRGGMTCSTMRNKNTARKWRGAGTSRAQKGRRRRKARQAGEEDLGNKKDRIGWGEVASESESTGESQGSEMDMDKEDVVEWMGLTSLFVLPAQASRLPPSLLLDVVAGLGRPGSTQGRGATPAQDPALYQTLGDALTAAEGDGSLANLLAVAGPARWLRARGLPTPPALMEALWRLMTWHPDADLAQGAYLNVRALMEHEARRREGGRVGGWRLEMGLVACLLQGLGVTFGRREGEGGEEEDGERGDGGASCHPPPSLMASTAWSYPPPRLGRGPGPSRVDPASEEEEEGGEEEGARRGRAGTVGDPEGRIPPTGNLRCLFLALAAAHAPPLAALSALSPPHRTSLLHALLLFSLDRYLQADGPSSLRAAIASLLSSFPPSLWPSPVLPALLHGLTGAEGRHQEAKNGVGHLGIPALVHIARCIPMALEPGRELLSALLRHLLEQRILALPSSPSASASLPPASSPSPLLASLSSLHIGEGGDRRTYLLRLLRLLDDPSFAPPFFAISPPSSAHQGREERGNSGARILQLALALALWVQLSLTSLPRPGGGEGPGGRDRERRAFAEEVEGRLKNLERGRLRGMNDERLQTAKDVLTQTVVEVRAWRGGGAEGGREGGTQTSLLGYAVRPGGEEVEGRE